MMVLPFQTAFLLFLMRFQTQSKHHDHNTDNQSATHSQMDTVQHCLLRHICARKFLADIGRTDKKRRANGTGNRVDGGQNRPRRAD